MGPQITMALLILFTTGANIVSMTKTGTKRDVTTSVVAAFARAATVIGVLYWGGFWKV